MERDFKRLRRWCVKKRLSGWRVSDICSHARIPRRTFYNWLKAYQKDGLKGLEIKSRVPKLIHRTSQEIIDEVLSVRREHGWCAEMIEAYLKSKNINVSHATIYKALKVNGLINPHKPRKQQTFIRWERKHPNSLWQTDYTIYKRKYITAFIDDHSRFCTAGSIFTEATTNNSIKLLSKAINNYGKPRQILTDHGTQYYAVKEGVSEFDKYCNSQSIQHILSGIGRPTTQGKIERFFQTMKKLLIRIPDIQEAVQYYNYTKPHTSLKYKTPAEVYFRKQ